MKKRLSIMSVAIVAVVALSGCIGEETTQVTPPVPIVPVETPTVPVDSAMNDATFTIEDDDITFVNGSFERSAAPGSASMASYILVPANEAQGDLSGDGVMDTAGIVMMNGGGSGTFFYVVALVDEEGTNGEFIGDRIKVEQVSITDGVIAVSYLERGADDAMVDAPTVEMTKKYVVTDGVLTEQK